MTPADVLEALAGEGVLDAVCLSEIEPWIFMIPLEPSRGHQTVKVHRSSIYAETYRVEVGTGLRMGLSFAVSPKESESVSGAVARGILYTVRRVPQKTEDRSFTVRDAVESRLYLARHVLGDRKPGCVLAAHTGEAKAIMARAWRVVVSNIEVDEATPAESGRHGSIWTRKGELPAETVLGVLSQVG